MTVYISEVSKFVCLSVSISTCTCSLSLDANKLKVCMSKQKRLELKTLDLTLVISSPVLNSQALFKVTSMLITVIASAKIEDCQQKCVCKGDFEWLTTLWPERYPIFVSAHYPFQLQQLLCHLQSKTKLSNSFSVVMKISHWTCGRMSLALLFINTDFRVQ